MFKTSKEFEQCLTKFLRGILDGKSKFLDFKDVIDNSDNFIDVAVFAGDRNFLIGATYKYHLGGFIENIDKNTTPRLSYAGLKLLEELESQ